MLCTITAQLAGIIADTLKRRNYEQTNDLRSYLLPVVQPEPIIEFNYFVGKVRNSKTVEMRSEYLHRRSIYMAPPKVSGHCAPRKKLLWIRRTIQQQRATDWVPVMRVNVRYTMFWSG